MDDRFISDVRVHSKCGAALCHTCFDRTVESNSAPTGEISPVAPIDVEEDIDQTLGAAFEDYAGQIFGPQPCSQISSTTGTTTVTLDEVTGGSNQEESMSVEALGPENSQSSEDLPSGDVIDIEDEPSGSSGAATGLNSSEERASVVKSTLPIRCPVS